MREWPAVSRRCRWPRGFLNRRPCGYSTCGRQLLIGAIKGTCAMAVVHTIQQPQNAEAPARVFSQAVYVIKACRHALRANDIGQREAVTTFSPERHASVATQRPAALACRAWVISSPIILIIIRDRSSFFLQAHQFSRQKQRLLTTLTPSSNADPFSDVKKKSPSVCSQT